MDLITSHHNYSWLRNLINDDEKWALHINYTQRRHLLSTGETDTITAKSVLHLKKVILSVRDGVNSIIRWEILSSDCIMAVDPYCQQLDWIAENSRENKIQFSICMTTRDFMLQSRPVKNYCNSDGSLFLIHLILMTWLQQTTIYSVLFLTIFVEKSSTVSTTWKLIWSHQLLWLIVQGFLWTRDAIAARALATSHRQWRCIYKGKLVVLFKVKKKIVEKNPQNFVANLINLWVSLETKEKILENKIKYK